MNANSLLGSARALSGEISAHAQEGERLCTMPTTLVDRIRDAGFFHLGMPAAIGGLEVDPLTIVAVIEELSRADGSAGWTAFIGNTTTFTAWLDPLVAKEMVAEQATFLASGAFAPTGTARPDGDGRLVVDGRWAFNSGCPHATWFMQGVMVMDGDAPRVVPPGRPDWRFAWFPSNEGEIIDTWHVSGLRGTGSHDVGASSVRVPPERTIMPFFEPPKFDGALYRLPFPTILSAYMSGWILGVSRRALDEFTLLAATKSRAMPPGRVLAEDEVVEVELARAEGAVRSARSFVLDAIGSSWDTVCQGDDSSMQQRANVALSMINAARVGRAAVDTMFSMAGGGALHDGSPIQRCARDIAAGSQHIISGLGQWRTVGRVLLGLDPDTPLV
jgi:alkylation response protein AidB-like acyl-CoA dehydrogenase